MRWKTFDQAPCHFVKKPPNFYDSFCRYFFLFLKKQNDSIEPRNV